MRVTSAESTELFVGPADAPLQLVRVTVSGVTEPTTVRVDGDGLSGAAVGQDVIEVPVAVEHPVIGQSRADGFRNVQRTAAGWNILLAAIGQSNRNAVAH